MIVAKCPLRVSLAGGSTDLQDFIDLHGHGEVISFPSSLYTYISLHENHRGKYIIDYTKREEVVFINDIKNDVAREVLKEYALPPVTITFNTDAHSSGTGLASSSSYIISLIKAITIFKGIRMSNYEICKKALEIERRFNPLTGYQDPYGCGIGSFKKIIFKKNEDPIIKYLDQSIFENLEMHLIYTRAVSNSTIALRKTAKSNRVDLLEIVEEMDQAIEKKDLHNFTKLVKLGWEKKKQITPHVAGNENVKKIDTILQNNPSILAHRLCGAGNRGYFLSLLKTTSYIPFNMQDSIKIGICQNGVTGTII
jgi:D-glycero-alpha-D-manno-heptose-7-phosphate kinase